jgi:transcriptional regulator with XRE-family HTH domain
MFSKALRLLRTLNDLSQADLANELGISAPDLCQIECGKRRPTVELIERYAEVFDIPASTIWLFSERLASNSTQERSRVYVAERMLQAVQALGGDANDDGREAAKSEEEQEVSN